MNAATNNTPNEGEKKSSRKNQGSRKVTIPIEKNILNIFDKRGNK
jgi:hypothetical protein